MCKYNVHHALRSGLSPDQAHRGINRQIAKVGEIERLDGFSCRLLFNFFATSSCNILSTSNIKFRDQILHEECDELPAPAWIQTDCLSSPQAWHTRGNSANTRTVLHPTSQLR